MVAHFLAITSRMSLPSILVCIMYIIHSCKDGCTLPSYNIQNESTLHLGMYHVHHTFLTICLHLQSSLSLQWYENLCDDSDRQDNHSWGQVFGHDHQHQGEDLSHRFFSSNSNSFWMVSCSRTGTLCQITTSRRDLPCTLFAIFMAIYRYFVEMLTGKTTTLDVESLIPCYGTGRKFVSKYKLF